MTAATSLLAIVQLGLRMNSRIAAQNRRRRFRRMAFKALLAAASLLSLLAAFVMAAAFLYLVLRGPLGPAYAALVLAGTLLVISGGLLAVMRFAFSSGQGEAKPVARSDSLTTELSRVLAPNRTVILLGLAIAGAVAGFTRHPPRS